MNKVWIFGLTALIAGNGCTTLSLEQYTLRQNRSSGEYRDTAVLDCLASVAADPARLPSFSLLVWGATTVTDSLGLSQTITAAPRAYTKEAFSGTAYRQPKGQWTVDPSAEYERLEALHAACLWVLFGPERATRESPEILGYQAEYLDTEPHFGVEGRLAKIPPGWVHVGRGTDVPKCARYKGHTGKTWVWVMPEDAEAFAQFTLVLLDIATLDLTFSVHSMPIIAELTTVMPTKIPAVGDNTKAVTVNTTERRYVKKEYKAAIEKAIQESMATGQPLALSRAQWLAYTSPYFGQRTAPAGTPSSAPASRAATTIILPAITAIPGRPAPTPPAVPLK